VLNWRLSFVQWNVICCEVFQLEKTEVLFLYSFGMEVFFSAAAVLDIN